jgi:hypothetical protein
MTRPLTVSQAFRPTLHVHKQEPPQAQTKLSELLTLLRQGKVSGGELKTTSGIEQEPVVKISGNKTKIGAC